MSKNKLGEITAADIIAAAGGEITAGIAAADGEVTADMETATAGGGDMMPLAPTASTNGHTEQAFLIPSKLLSVDIETAHADEKVIQREIELYTPPSNIKDPEKIENNRQEFIKRVREKSALLDDAPIACIGNRTENVGRVFSAMNKKCRDKKTGLYFVSPENEEKMLIEFRDWADHSFNLQTIIIGFNILAFDLPRIRAACMRHNIRLPQLLMPRILDEERQPVIDVMKMFVRAYTADCYNDFSISLQEVERRLGFKDYKSKISGKEIPDMVARGEFKEVETYCDLDATETLGSYMKLIGIYKGMK